MTESFTASGTRPLGRVQSSSRAVLVTGAAGNIGSYFAQHAHQQYALRLMIRPGDDAASIAPFGDVIAVDLADLEALKRACAGIDTVLHLAGDPSPSAPWSSLLPNNIVGTYHMMVAARAAGCRRLVYASSIHAVSGYPADVQVKTSEPVNPGDLYGVSKCFGEALGRYMAEQEGLSVIAVRIGAFQPPEAARSPEAVGMMDAWVSQRDLCDLLCRAIDVQDIQWAVLQGVSDNRFKRLDISDARSLVGYQPQDDFTAENSALRDLKLADATTEHSLRDRPQESGIREELAERP